MRSGTLGLFYFCKFVELIFLAVLTVLIFGSGTWLIHRILNSVDISKTERQCLIHVPICLVFAFFNLFYNNLLINLRFKCKIKCVTAGLCIFDFFNWIGCYCCLRKPCRDKCFTPWTLGKWFVKVIIFGYTIYILKARESEIMALEREAAIFY